jgi:tRNA nucleotidyltransferase (CCA-adding enzyme)
MNLLSDLPHAQRRALALVREVAVEKECHPYLVGGPVRDLLLGRPAVDVDLTLETGGSTLARAIAKRIDGRVRSFPQFLTYKVTAPEFPEIDIATARKERYRHPGALPAVAAGRLKDDLIRRDFSINAIALDLLDGTLHDPAGGSADLERRVVRVLHPNSFLDDPTRVFRAVRLAQRLGFTLDPATEDAMSAALAAGAISTVSKERIWRELFLAMDEEQAPAILTDLSSRGALDPLFSRRPPQEMRRRLDLMKREVAQTPELDRYVVYTGVMLHGDASPIDFEGSGFSQKRARSIVEIANELPRITEEATTASDDRERFRIYRTHTPEILAVLAAENPAQREHLRRYEEFERFTLPLRGNDLEVPGGPHVARALEEAKTAVFNGEVAPENARSYAREVARRYLEETR